MEIRRATEKDLDALADLRRWVHDIHVEARPDFFKPLVSEASRENFAERLKDEKSVILIAEESELVGYMVAIVRERPENQLRFAFKSLYIEQIAVARDFRRRGLAAKLVEEAKAIAREKGIHRLDLEVWCFNQEAQSLFRSQGFEPETQRMHLDL